MNLPLNAYALGPSLHDWEWEEQEIERDREEARRESFITDLKKEVARPWHWLNKHREDDLKELFNDALTLLYEDEQQSNDLITLLISIWSQPSDNPDCGKLSHLIETALDAIALQHFEKATDL